MRRPSASVLMMSTHLPLSALTMSPGREEWGPGMFSTAGATARSGVPGARRGAGAGGAGTGEGGPRGAAPPPRREPGDGGDGRDHGAGTGLVHLHFFHPLGRLDADAAGIEADALADDGQVAAGGIELALLPG